MTIWLYGAVLKIYFRRFDICFVGTFILLCTWLVSCFVGPFTLLCTWLVSCFVGPFT